MAEKEKEEDEKFVLFLKGSSIYKNNQIGACIKSQRVLMILKLKGLEDKFDKKFIYDVTKNQDRDFKSVCATQPPVLRLVGREEVEYQDVGEIATYLEENFSGTPLDTGGEEKYDEANKLVNNTTLMLDLNTWMKRKDEERNHSCNTKFHNTLREINRVLGNTFEKFGGPYLCGPDLMLPDCILLPKLYHAKVAALYTKGYDFTKSDPRDRDDVNNPEFRNIARYLKAAQGNPVFKESCPSEKEIQEKWRSFRK